MGHIFKGVVRGTVEDFGAQEGQTEGWNFKEQCHWLGGWRLRRERVVNRTFTIPEELYELRGLFLRSMRTEEQMPMIWKTFRAKLCILVHLPHLRAIRTRDRMSCWT